MVYGGLSDNLLLDSLQVGVGRYEPSDAKFTVVNLDLVFALRRSDRINEREVVRIPEQSDTESQSVNH